MARSSMGSSTFSSVLTLALWRFRHTWFLLLVTTLGMVTAVIIACAVPLFITVTTTAGLRNTLNAQPTSSEIRIDTATLGASTQLVSAVQEQFNPLFQHDLGNILTQPTQFLLQSNNFTVVSPKPPVRTYLFDTFATSMQQAASHIRLIQGRLPHDMGKQIEIVLTPGTAQSFGVTVGSTMRLRLSYFHQLPDVTQQDYTKYAKSTYVDAHVVGLIAVDEADLAHWHGNDFTPSIALDGTMKIQMYSVLTSGTALLSFFDSIATQQHTDTTYIDGIDLSWYYHLDPSRISVTQIDGIIARLSSLKTTLDQRYATLENYGGYSADAPPSFPYLVNVNPYSILFPDVGVQSSLEQFRERTTVTRIPSTVIAVQILILILLFISLMTDLLVDRQADAIAVLRSRGASRGQIFGTLMTQSVGMGFVALLVGLPLAYVLVILVSHRILPMQVQDALNVITNNPLQALQSVVAYAALVVLVVLLTMSFSLLRVVRMDVLATRREAARSTQRAFWQRLHLDIIAAVIALLGYGVTLYLTTLGSVLSGTIKAISAALFSLISPYFLIIVLLLLFLRFFPLLLRLGAWFTVRGRTAASMLALAQMSRSPRQSVRMTTLLALTITFALFSLIFFATQEQRINDLAAYQAGADISGTLPDSSALSVEQTETQYRAISGVTSASAGFIDTGTVSDANIALNLELRGIDTNTYEQTALWPTQASSQSLSSLVEVLTAKRQYGIHNTLVPVIVDETTQRTLALHLGSTFLINRGDIALAPDMHCMVVAVVAQIPTVVNTADISNPAYDVPSGGVLFDYETYNAIYMQQAQALGKGNDTLPVNWLLLHTRDDAASLHSVRMALNTLELHLNDMSDRRVLIDTLHTDPLTLTLEGILSIGTVATLLLALLGDLLASWSSARTRLTNFAVLRALGTSPRQVASVLTWEQGLIYGIGILLGTGFGVLLATTVVPTLIYYGLSLQNTLPVQIIVPTSLVLTLGAFIAVFILALGMMVRIVSRPSMSQMLRLNED